MNPQINTNHSLAERLKIVLFAVVLLGACGWQWLGLVNQDWSSSKQEIVEAIERDSLASQYGKKHVQKAKGMLGLRADGIIVHKGNSYLVDDLQYLSQRSDYLGGEQSPYQVILDFREQLARRNIELIVMIVNGKGCGSNAATSRLLDDLTEKGMHLLHVSGEPVDKYLKHDSHWRPELMEKYARKLADLTVSLAPEIERGRLTLFERKEMVTNHGDLVRDGFANQSDESVEVRSVAPEKITKNNSQILLLGDSYTNIFSESEMGWGHSAGLAERLSFHLQSWCDVIAINGNGASASRKALARTPAILEGKKVVVWQFAARELDLGKWQVISIPRQKSHLTDKSLTSGYEEFTVVALPKWNFNSPYPSSLTEVLLARKSDGKEVLARLLLKKERKFTKASRLRVGATVRLKLSDLSQQKSYQRAEEFTLDRYDLELFWAEME